MEAFGIYSLKAGIILVLFWGIYLLFLQRETFYRFNRGFLLAGLIAAVVFPLIVFRYTVEISVPAIPIYSIDGLETMPAGVDKLTFSAMCYRLLPVIYWLVFITLLIFRSIGLARIFKSIRRNNHQRCAGYRIIESSDFDGAFSFFQFVFLPSHLNEAEKHIILKHENAHIKQKHWIDLLLTNMLRLIWWFNPVMRFYEKAVRNNHEYLADKESLTDYQQTNYQQTLLNRWFKTSVFPLTNTFSNTNHLKRIIMMKKDISNPFKKLYALLAIPALVIFLSAYAEKVYVVQDPTSVFNVDSEATQQRAQRDQRLAQIRVQRARTINTNLLLFLMNKRKQTLNNPQAEQSINERMQVLIKADLLYVLNDPETTYNPLILVNGKETSNIENIKAEDVISISILTGSTTDVYGEKGKNGVILIITKKESQQTTN